MFTITFCYSGNSGKHPHTIRVIQFIILLIWMIWRINYTTPVPEDNPRVRVPA
jgi:hypothetical protein